jgi:hypothetical protein
MLAGGAATSGLHELRRELAQGRSIEIAGYELHPQLAAALARLDLAAVPPAVRRVHWFELATQGGAPLRPASRRVVQTWTGGALRISTTVVAGDPFWSTIEITECEALLAATLEAMSSLD